MRNRNGVMTHLEVVKMDPFFTSERCGGGVPRTTTTRAYRPHNCVLAHLDVVWMDPFFTSERCGGGKDDIQNNQNQSIQTTQWCSDSPRGSINGPFLH